MAAVVGVRGVDRLAIVGSGEEGVDVHNEDAAVCRRLADLVTQDQYVLGDEAMSRTSDPEDLKRTFQRSGVKPDKQSAASARRAGMPTGRNV